MWLKLSVVESGAIPGRRKKRRSPLSRVSKPSPSSVSLCAAAYGAGKFITWALFSCFSSPLLTRRGEVKLRRRASGETITGPLLFQSWGHPSARRSRNKGQGFIAGSTVWKETHSNIVWLWEIVRRRPCCFLLDGMWAYDQCPGPGAEVLLLLYIFCRNFLHARERPSRGVERDSLLVLGCHPRFPWHVDGRQRRGGRKKGKRGCVKGSWSQSRTGGRVTWSVFLLLFSEWILDSLLSVIEKVESFVLVSKKVQRSVEHVSDAFRIRQTALLFAFTALILNIITTLWS